MVRKTINNIRSFSKEFTERINKPTPKWFKWLRWGAYVFAGASGGIAAVVTQPWSTIVAVVGALAIGVAGTTYLPTDDDMDKKSN